MMLNVVVFVCVVLSSQLCKGQPNPPNHWPIRLNRSLPLGFEILDPTVEGTDLGEQPTGQVPRRPWNPFRRDFWDNNRWRKIDVSPTRLEESIVIHKLIEGINNVSRSNLVVSSRDWRNLNDLRRKLRDDGMNKPIFHLVNSTTSNTSVSSLTVPDIINRLLQDPKLGRNDQIELRTLLVYYTLLQGNTATIAPTVGRTGNSTVPAVNNTVTAGVKPNITIANTGNGKK